MIKDIILDKGPTIIGGTVAPLTQTDALQVLPTLDACIYTVIIAVIGATVGYFVKLFIDIILNTCNLNPFIYGRYKKNDKGRDRRNAKRITKEDRSDVSEHNVPSVGDKERPVTTEK